MRELLRSRVAAAVGSAVLTASLIGGSAVAARMFGSGAIRDNSIRSRDVRNDTLRSRDVDNGSIQSLDVRNGAIQSRDVRNGTLGSRDLNQATRESLGGDAPVLDTIGHLLHVNDGTAEIAHLTYSLAEPIALSELTELTFFQELVYGSGNFGASVILGVDANGDGNYDADDLAWHMGATTHDPAQLGEDTFVAMDGVNPTMTKVDAPSVKQWWTPNSAGNGFAGPTNSNCYNDLATVVHNCTEGRFTPDDQVHVIRLVLGGSQSWNDIAIRLTTFSIEGKLEPGVATAN